MDENVQLEARVWSRIMGQKLEEPRENSETAAFLGAECAALEMYCRLRRQFPKEAACLMKLAKERIKYLKAQYFVETGRVFCGNSPQTTEFLCQKEAIRQRVIFLTRMGEKSHNYRKQKDILMGILGKLV